MSPLLPALVVPALVVAIVTFATALYLFIPTPVLMH